MQLRRVILWLTILAALALPGQAAAFGGNYTFAGGTPHERDQVTAALNASSFDWSVVPARVTIRIAPGIDSNAVPGTISLDGNLLDAGPFAWGVVQHEYAHQVDFFLFTPQLRTALTSKLGAASWWQSAGEAHAAAGAERFASTLSWAYWPSQDNVMRPTSPTDESAALPPVKFRALVASILGPQTRQLLTLKRRG